MVALLADVLLPALLALLVKLHSLWRSLSGLCSTAAARLAAAMPALRPLLAALVALPPLDHIGSRPRPPTVLGVAIAEEIADDEWPVAVEVLGGLLSW